MQLMGDVFDIAVNDYGYDGDTFAQMFCGGDICRRIENGEPAYLLGKSGAEVVSGFLERTAEKEYMVREITSPRYGRSPEFWAGWAAAYFQWNSRMSYEQLFQKILFSELVSLYPALHEADITKVADVMESRIESRSPETNLKRIRTAYGCSQSELARLSGVSLRSIQMYEQRRKDINKAQVDTLLRIARVLGCRVEDLTENTGMAR